MPTGAKPEVGAFTREVGALLRARIARLGLTQAETAEASGISSSQFSKMLKGTRNIDLDQLDKICYYLGLDMIDVIPEADRETEARFLGWGPTLDPSA